MCRHRSIGCVRDFFSSSVRDFFGGSVRDFLAEEDGPTTVEYAVMLGLILGVCIAAVAFLGTQNRDRFDESGTAISGAFGN